MADESSTARPAVGGPNGPPTGRRGIRRGLLLAVVALTVVLIIGALAWGLDLNDQVQSLDARLHEMSSSEHALAKRLDASQHEQPDVSKVSDAVSPSVFTVDAGDSVGSSWVAQEGHTGSDLVTNFHVIENLWNAGGRTVSLRNPTRTLQGTITKVDPVSDLAEIHVAQKLTPLTITTTKPPVGDPIIVFGSPLGLTDTLTTGVISAYRTEDGTEYLQFSAAASPGSSGGPVVDGRSRVLGVATMKRIDTGAEGLSFAIESRDVCNSLALACRR